MRGLVLDAVVVEEGVSGSIPIVDRPAAGPLFAKLAKDDVGHCAKARPAVSLSLGWETPRKRVQKAKLSKPRRQYPGGGWRQSAQAG